MSGEWDRPLSREIVFSTDRKATIRKTLPVNQLFRSGVWSAGMLETFRKAQLGEIDDPQEALALTDSIVIGMFVDPVLTPETIGFLEDVELKETVTAAFEGAAEADSFRGDDGGPGSGSVRDALGDAPERVARPRARKPGGVRAGRKAG